MQIVANLVCLNEREYLPHVLRTLRFCDEIVVVDGGSTDGSVDYLHAAPGVRLVQFPWQQDFAAQRQRALEASGVPDPSRWILKWDCDELATEGLITGLRDYLTATSARVEAYHVRIWHLAGDRQHYASNYPEVHRRLFRHMPTAHWWQPVHEQIAGLSTVETLPDEMSVVHLAFLDRVRQRRKGEQYARMAGSGFATWQELVYRPYALSPLPVSYESDPDLLAFMDALPQREP